MDKSVVFLDIDGAVAPYERDWRRSGVYSLSDEYDYDIITNLRIPIAKHVHDFLCSLTPENAVWSSSWGDSSNAVNDALGIDHFPVMMDTMKKLHDGKKYTIHRYLEEHPEINNAILVEDEPYSVDNIDLTVIKTHRFTGMTVEDVKKIYHMMG